MPRAIEFYFDFVSPYSYFGNDRLDFVADALDARKA
jgi:2-hydroxychromene-2-carboxylate isomerase